jgi:hypothetical protein
MPAGAEAPTLVSHSARSFGRLAARVLLFGGVGGFILLAAGGAAGRWRIVPAPERTLGTSHTSDDLVFVVPVPVQRLEPGDVVIVRDRDEKALLRLDRIVDSEGPQVEFAGDPPGRVRRLGGTAWRVSRSVPYAGAVLRLFAGPVQGALFVLFGLALVVRSEMKRETDPAASGQEPAAVG